MNNVLYFRAVDNLVPDKGSGFLDLLQPSMERRETFFDQFFADLVSEGIGSAPRLLVAPQSPEFRGVSGVK